MFYCWTSLADIILTSNKIMEECESVVRMRFPFSDNWLGDYKVTKKLLDRCERRGRGLIIVSCVLSSVQFLPPPPPLTPPSRHISIFWPGDTLVIKTMMARLVYDQQKNTVFNTSNHLLPGKHNPLLWLNVRIECVLPSPRRDLRSSIMNISEQRNISRRDRRNCIVLSDQPLANKLPGDPPSLVW